MFQGLALNVIIVKTQETLYKKALDERKTFPDSLEGLKVKLNIRFKSLAISIILFVELFFLTLENNSI